MAMIIETGALVPNANSYVSVEEADDYHTTYGNVTWTANADVAKKETALIKATQSIELLYGQKYLSYPLTSNQSLLFPRMVMVVNRIQLIASYSIPVQLKQAVAEAALKYMLGEELFPLPNTEANLTSKSIDVAGVIKKSMTWAKAPATEQHAGFNKIELILKPILRNESYVPASMSL